MKKHFLVEQPPHSKMYRLLVDDINDNKNFGTATDIDKIEYNQRLLGEDFVQKIEINKLFTDDGLTSVFPVGRFITVLELKKDGTKGCMTFMDFDVRLEIDEFRTVLSSQFSPNVVREWLKLHSVVSSVFSSEDDVFELVRPNLS